MPLSTFMQKGLTTLLKVVKITSPEGLVKLLTTLTEHFTLSTYEIAKAYQESYESALTAINLGLGQSGFFHAQVIKEFAREIEPHYLRHFITVRHIQSPSEIQEFCRRATHQYQALIKYKQNLFQASPSLLTETDLASLITDNDSLSITELVLEELHTFVHVEEPFLAFLRHRDLLGTAIVFFLYEQLRQEPRVERTFAALQRQGLWQNLHDLKHTLQQLMSQLGLSEQLKGQADITLHTPEQLQTIEHVVEKLQQLPYNIPHYSQLAMWGGRLLSSKNAYLQAEHLFEQAKYATQDDEDRALAEFNLFQTQLKHRVFNQALTHLQEAIRFNPQRYALHDIEKYPILKLLGAGGTGCVFLCQHKLQKKSVVVKCFWESRKGPIETVFKEAFAMSHFAGQYVPTPLDYGYADPINQERAFFVTEYIEGAIDGEAWLEQYGKLDLALGLQVGLQLAKGLQVAHRAGFLHLDLKPANLLINKTSSEVNVKIIDFGLSTLITSMPQHTYHVSCLQRGMFGTLHYAPPEQQGIEKYGRPSVKSDVFAWGATLYRLLTCDLPHKLNPKRLKESPQLFDLICECVEEEPLQRPSLDRVISQLEKLHVSSGVDSQPDDELEKLLEMARIKYGQKSYSSYLPLNNEGRDYQPNNELYVVCPKCDGIFTTFEEGEAMCPQCHGEFEIDQEGFVIASYDDDDDEYEEESEEEEYYEDEYYDDEEEEEYDDSSYYEDEEEYEEDEEYDDDEEEYYEEEYDEDENYEEDDDR